MKINEIENRKPIEKNFDTKNLFFERISKTDKLLIRLSKRKETNIAKGTNERGEITTEHTQMKKTVRDHYEQLYASKLEI